MPESTKFYANGVNATTGQYGLEPMTEDQLLEAIKGESWLTEAEKNYLDSKNKQIKLREKYKELGGLEVQLESATDDAEITAKIEKCKAQIEELEHLGVVAHIDPTKLDETGWGIIFAEKADPAIQEALSDLIDYRKTQAGNYFKLFAGDDGYRSGDTYIKFLNRHGAAPGPVDPKKGVPYYLLLVGSPAEIPYRFQYQLDVQYAVGRIHFDTLDDYVRYAHSVVSADKGEIKLARQASFFGVANPFDRATEQSAKHLIEPLYQTFTGKDLGWDFDLFAREKATKAQLTQLLGGEQTPALLFTASHGVEFAPDDPRQTLHQGALLCQDWEGPEDHDGPITQDLYFAGDDLTGETALLGLMTFHFACYGAGTPQFDEFAGLRKEKKQIASQPFLANLPKQLLSHGALATVGHVERAWGHSFFWPGAGEQLSVFESTLERLLTGVPVGLAVEYFNERYAELATIVNGDLEEIDFLPDLSHVPGNWTACADARNYVIIGDPAARLPVAALNEATTDRPVIIVAASEQDTTIETEKFAPPFDISDEDWHNTPPAVQRVLLDAAEKLKN